MITRKLPILSCSDVEFVRDKQTNYSYAFRRLYKMFELSSDNGFIDEFKEKFDLNNSEYRSLKSDVESFKKREQADWEDKVKRVAEIQSIVDKLKDELDTYLSNGQNDKKAITDIRRQIYKLEHKQSDLAKCVGKECTFGGLSLIRQITKECNKIERDEKLISELKVQFSENRIRPFQIEGEANQKGNRFFDITDISNGIIAYKPFRGKKIELKVKLQKRIREELSKLAILANNKEIPITISLSNKFICITFDEERLNRYNLDKTSIRSECKAIKSERHPKETESELIRGIYKKYHREQEERKLIGKLENRAVSVDLNPGYIGFSIIDRKDDNGVSVVFEGQFDFTKLTKKSGKSSTHKDSKYLTNKRKHEISIVLKELFKFAKHYKCSKFVMEDLNFDQDNDLVNKEANRKAKNVWLREFTESIIQRRCNETGIELIKVNPIYSSFIGNIQHPYCDAINASIEIGRRGLYKYIKGGFYPSITEDDISTLESIFGNVDYSHGLCSWSEIYRLSRNSCRNGTEFANRWRVKPNKAKHRYRLQSMNSCKSNVKLLIYN